MFKKLSINLLLAVIFASAAAAQTTDAEKMEKAGKLKEEAVVFLRETSSEIMNLRTAENRIGFNAELASLMWFHDEREARIMFNSVTGDFRQMLVGLDAQINSFEFDQTEYALGSIPFISSSNQKAQVFRKFNKAMGVRQQIAGALSDHDALLAYAFFTDTAQAVTNPVLREQMARSDAYFETRLLQAVAEQDASKGVEFGRKSLAGGVNNNHLELLKKIYAKDAEAGAAFGADIVGKLRSAGEDEGNLYLFSSLLEIGADNRQQIKDKPTQRPILSDQDLRDMAEAAGRILLNKSPETISSYSLIIDNIEKFSPSRAVQLRQKMKTATSSKVAAMSTPEAKIVEGIYEKQQLERERQEKALEDVKAIGTKELSDEQRAAVIAEASRMIEQIEDPTAKVTALSGLAAQVAKAGDKETALQIMKQAESMISLTPKTYVDYMQMWVLASGYSQFEPERSFPVLEGAVYNLNDTISAFIKVGEFIDVGGDLIVDGEVQVSGFGGGLARELIGALDASESSLRNLAEADFARTRRLTDKFDRTEIRLLAKMLILRAVLGEKTASVDTELPETDQ